MRFLHNLLQVFVIAFYRQFFWGRDLCFLRVYLRTIPKYINM